MRPFITEEIIDIPSDINVELKENKIILSKGDKKIEINLEWPRIILKKENNNLIFRVYFATRRDLRVFYTIVSKTKNAVEGLKNGYRYKLRAVYTHFPFKISIKGNKFIVENFLGEKSTREIEVPKEIKVKIEGQDIIVEGYDLEKLGNFAGLLESLTRIKEKDLRKFQDGIYIVEKP